MVTQGTLTVRCTMVSIIVLRGEGPATELLMLQRATGRLASVWGYCAGHVEAGERGWEAALRELAEETGLVPTTLYSSTFCEQFYSAADDVIEVVPAFVARVPHEPAVRLNSEHMEYRWVPIADAADRFPFGSQRDLVAHVRREYVDREPSAYLAVWNNAPDGQPSP